jgi:anti-anti-sigma regulatory factor
VFRLTEHSSRDRLVLKLEGRCSSEVVEALQASWVTARLQAAGRPIWIDLTDVLLVDAAARAQLARMHLAGARFVSRGCLMRELVREITCTEPYGR